MLLKSIFLADGPHGLRKQAGSADHLGINASEPATCFPTAAGIGNSWDEELATLCGRTIGKEAACQQVNVLLGPGLNIKRRVCVISEHLDEIVRYVLHDLHSGATLGEIIGAYDKTPRMEMVAIVDKNEYRQLMDYVRKIDPKAFVPVYSVSDMRYQPKK